jgi:hypothetical protein
MVSGIHCRIAKGHLILYIIRGSKSHSSKLHVILFLWPSDPISTVIKRYMIPSCNCHQLIEPGNRPPPYYTTLPENTGKTTKVLGSSPYCKHSSSAAAHFLVPLLPRAWLSDLSVSKTTVLGCYLPIEDCMRTHIILCNIWKGVALCLFWDSALVKAILLYVYYISSDSSGLN